MGKVASLSTAIRQECLKHSRKAALISIQTAHTFSNAKGTGTELDVKKLLTQQVDSIALLGHMSWRVCAGTRSNSFNKPEFAPICADTGQSSKFLFGDDLQKQLKEAKGSSSFGKVVKTSQGRNASHKSYHAYPKRNNYDNGRHRQGGSTYETASRSDFYRRGRPYPRKKGARQPQQKK